MIFGEVSHVWTRNTTNGSVSHKSQQILGAFHRLHQPKKPPKKTCIPFNPRWNMKHFGTAWPEPPRSSRSSPFLCIWTGWKMLENRCCFSWEQLIYPIGSIYAIYGNIYHQYTPNVSIYIYTIHGFYGYWSYNWMWISWCLSLIWPWKISWSSQV